MKKTTWNQLMCAMEAKKGRQVNIAQMSEISKNANRASKGAYYAMVDAIEALPPALGKLLKCQDSKEGFRPDVPVDPMK